MMEQALQVSPPPAARGGIAKVSVAAKPHVLLLPNYLAAAAAAFRSDTGAGDMSEAGAGAGDMSEAGAGDMSEAGAGADHRCHGSGLCLGCGPVTAPVQRMLSKL